MAIDNQTNFCCDSDKKYTKYNYSIMCKGEINTFKDKIIRKQNH